MSGRVKKAAAPRKKANGYKMPAPIATGEVIHDTIGKKKWRIGPSIGVGGFGEIYSACDHESSSKGSNYPFVVKIVSISSLSSSKISMFVQPLQNLLMKVPICFMGA